MIAVWIDREHAKIFKLIDDQIKMKSFEARHQEHHSHAVDQIDLQKREREFFLEICDELNAASQILILGPGVAKHHFRNYLTEQQPSVAKKIKGCETVDHPTDAQIAALAKKFFEPAPV